MKDYHFSPFDREELQQELQANFPRYIVRKRASSIQVRTKKFTTTMNINLALKQKKGRVRVSSNLTLAPLMIMFFWPLAIYIFSKKKKINALEKEVVDSLHTILDKDYILA